MSIFDPHNSWLFGNDGTRDEKEQEKEHQDTLCSLIKQHQEYMGIIEEHKYVLRGSKIGCNYGTDKILLDMNEDYGITWSVDGAEDGMPVATCAECHPDNIHHFGSCLCPETQYVKRLPRTKGMWDNGESAEKLVNNIFAHICVPLIKEDQGWMQVGEDVLVEVGYENYKPLLLDNAVLVCQYGGVIRVLEVPGGEEEEEEDLRRILFNIMQLDGDSAEEKKLAEYIETLNENIRNRVKDDELYEKLVWNQDKIDIIWEKCTDFYEKYQVLVDPRMLIAIIVAEGTGSFNTSSENKAGDGGNGVHDDFDKDCQNAVDLLGTKIMAYRYYSDEFTVAVVNSNNLKGMEKCETKADVDILHYLNWETPRLFFDDAQFDVGVYAEDNNWHRNVRDIYGNLVDLNISKETETYTKYILKLDKNIFLEAAEEYKIDVDKQVNFKAIQNGKDDKGRNNGEYTVVGIIQP